MRSILCFPWQLLEHGLSPFAQKLLPCTSSELFVFVVLQLSCTSSELFAFVVLQFSWAIIEERYKMGYMQDTNYFIQAPFRSGL